MREREPLPQDRDFEELLAGSLPEVPPMEAVREVTPLGRSVGLLALGLALSGLTLELGLGVRLLCRLAGAALGLLGAAELCLGRKAGVRRGLCLLALGALAALALPRLMYARWDLWQNLFSDVLPQVCRVLGALLCLLGLRRLRRENGWLRACWGAACLRLALLWGTALWLATPWDIPAWLERRLAPLGIALLVGQTLCLWRGLAALRRKAGQPPRAGAAAGLALWYAAVLGGTWLAGGHITLRPALLWGLLALYALLLWGLARLARELEESGYAVEAAPARLSDGRLALALLAALAALVFGSYRFLSGFSMDWQPREEQPLSQAAQEVRDRLSYLEMPEVILQDLTEEELLSCRGALRVTWSQTLEGQGRNGRVLPLGKYTDSWEQIYETRGQGVYDILLTDAAVLMRGEDGGWTWKLIHHFRWLGERRNAGTELLVLTAAPDYLPEDDTWTLVEDCRGRLLCERDGRTLTAPYYRQERTEEVPEPDPIFGRTETPTPRTYLEFSLPRQAEAPRGYLTYTIHGTGVEGRRVISWVDYYHQSQWPIYPLETARDYALRDSWNSRRKFDHFFDHFGFAPQYHSLETGGTGEPEGMDDPYHSRDDWT